MSTQICYKCKTEKTIDDFYKNQKKCKACEAEGYKERKKKEAASANQNATKKCLKCQETLEISKFTVGKNTCRKCISIYDKERKTLQKKDILILPVNTIVATTQVCYKCKIEKSIDDFYKNQKKCKTCETEYHKHRHAKKQNEVVVNPDATKTCIKCEKTLDMSKFTIGKNTCRDCINKYERERKAANNPNPKPERPPLFSAKPIIPRFENESRVQELTCNQMECQKRKEYWIIQSKKYYKENKEKVKAYAEQYKKKTQ